MKTLSKYLIAFSGGAFLVLGGTALAQIVPTMTHESELFSDVQKGTFFENSVTKLVRQGVVQGYEDGTFGPNDSVTRAQVSVMIDRYDREVIQPLREQLQKIRAESDLGQCGDSRIQVGESCDDGNLLDGDGCSSDCLKEKTIQPVSGQVPPKNITPSENDTCMYNDKKYAVGQSFQAMDGCNNCACEQGGKVVCTMYACEPR